MSASTAGALKALLEGASLGVAIYRDRAPEAAALPFITISEAISVVPDRAFNQFDDPEGHVVEEAQLDVWQTWRNSTTGTMVENYTLPDRVVKAAKGAALPTAPTAVAGLRVLGRVRRFEEDANLVHDIVTVELRRTLTPV